MEFFSFFLSRSRSFYEVRRKERKKNFKYNKLTLSLSLSLSPQQDPDAPQRAGGSYAAGSEAAAAAASSSLRAARTYAPLNNKAMELRKLCNHYCLSYPHAPDPGWDESRGEQTPGW